MLYFVTGTDTDSGKTLISSALLHKASGKKCGFKPIASGCDMTEFGLRNTDAMALISQSNIELSYQQVNPIAFEPAIAPHIAASNEQVDLSLERVVNLLVESANIDADFTLIEGAGGWRLPLGQRHYLSDAIKQLNNQLQNKHDGPKPLGVVLVVGMKLGCLNHALLTQDAILNDGLPIVGWVANQVDPQMSEIDANLASLRQMMSSPFLGYVPYLECPTPEDAAQHLTTL
ncbi:dethiobiotin synthase [Shewanella maritima]|uniref:dethiobiotin synthase n=1 Tax=Shewanella maritima TaxID=2520507 RepID=UPI003736D9F1